MHDRLGSLRGILRGLDASGRGAVGREPADSVGDKSGEFVRWSAKLTAMDTVRFGRALGMGARMAAKTVVEAVDAAAAPAPNVPLSAASAKPHGTGQPAERGVAPDPAHGSRARLAPISGRDLRKSSRRFRQAMWNPLARLSGVLWLEITGVFFGLFALSASVGAWRLRGEWHGSPVNPAGHTHLLMTIAVALLFAYFCATSFLRARRRSRQT